MKKLVILIFCTLTVLTYGQQKPESKLNFDITDFNKKFEVAQWLYKYDLVAWWTSDSVMVQNKKDIARLGKEWFCFPDQNDTWHAVYGKYNNGKFDLVFHYTVDNKLKVKRTNNPVDTLILNSFSRALITANNQLTSLKDTSSIRFNQFIKQNEDKTFTVWILPGFQPDGTAVYGGEFIFTINRTGNTLLKVDSYFHGNFSGFKVDKSREVWMNYRDKEKPTLGAIFFVWYYKNYFKNIFIDNSISKSTIVKNEDNTYSWVHTEKEQGNKIKIIR
jgi:hypothetical protein